ncbi:predicted protein [Botrytis cinerea T4]|uniref:Uncharacterized protein n=1 Tax=Botryotinia fuckeliana (strain T4) TaxID=999810 RepID=G2YFY3_BOTF4|nr:predicted protein [Botrytis cinerea T4]
MFVHTFVRKRYRKCLCGSIFEHRRRTPKHGYIIT